MRVIRVTSNTATCDAKSGVIDKYSVAGKYNMHVILVKFNTNNYNDMNEITDKSSIFLVVLICGL